MSTRTYLNCCVAPADKLHLETGRFGKKSVDGVRFEVVSEGDAIVLDRVGVERLLSLLNDFIKHGA